LGKNKFRLIATDVDGTLLDDRSNLPPYNKKALLACIDNGIGVVLATGKTIDAVYPLIRDLDLKLPQITQSGATMVNRDRRIINSISLGEENFFEAVRTIKKKGYCPLACLGDGKIFYDKYHPNMESIKAVGERIIKVDNIETKFFARHSSVISIPIRESDPLDAFLREKYSLKLQIVRSGEYFFDILNKKATKGNALKEILKILNIKKSQVVAFGDSYNDLSMFEVAGLNIAVRNSYPHILKKADIITDENYNCGLGKALYKYILKPS